MEKKNVSQCMIFQVHVRVASPPLLYPCYMGINIPTREELIANKLDPVKLAKHVGK
jgi:amidophosphoribosyltransferase